MELPPDRLEDGGEGFEPSRGLTTPSDLRDWQKSADLQALYSVFASKFASTNRTSCRIAAVLAFVALGSVATVSSSVVEDRQVE
jgi:hypothetical protein